MLDFSILEGKDLTVKSLNVYANSTPVIPPDTYICKKGTRLFSRFFYIVSGRMIFCKNTENELHASSGDILYLPTDTEYVSEWEAGENGSFITANFILNDTDTVFSDKTEIALHDSTGTYLALFRKLLDIWTKGAFGTHIKALSVFLEIMYGITEESSKMLLAAEYSDIADGITYIENRFIEEFSVDDLCRLCSVSPATFRRKFKKYSSLSPITYRNLLRCRRARELLESGEYTVTESALSVGFTDLSYFNRVYSGFFGTAPSLAIKSKQKNSFGQKL